MRPARDVRMMRVAAVIATGSTCLRRAVGCVLTDARGKILATGYNGRAAGLPHCNETGDAEDRCERCSAPLYASNLCVRCGHVSTTPPVPPGYPHACAGATAPSGTSLDACEAIHAEQNALLQCADVRAVDTAYVTVSPCVTCTKLLLNTGCWRIVFAEAYTVVEPSRALWERAGRAWTLLGCLK